MQSKSKTVKKPGAPITKKQSKFLISLIKKKYAEPYIQQKLVAKMNRMNVGEASIAINTLLESKEYREL